MTKHRDHGGDLTAACARHGGTPEDWIDLSTGINRVPYPFSAPAPAAWRTLPGRADTDRLIVAARGAYGTDWPILPLAGAQAAIQLLPCLRAAGPVRIMGPTYNEYAAALTAAGADIVQVGTVGDLAGAGLGILVNPNNPDGRQTAPDTLRDLAAKVGLLVIDESFADPHPGLSVLTGPCPDNVVVLRSFGKFYGLAGLRLGFALGADQHLGRMAQQAGPWAVSGPALDIGGQALADDAWRADSIARLGEDAARADALAARAGWTLVGGTALFRLYDTPDARATQMRLAQAHIWSRIFPYSDRWLRLGLPGTEAEWARLEAALR
ncbi:L-threonine 3-O-phosphate decarboxylase [Rhodovulum sp. P5]|uniref:threonine-phosphate decarboxylase CobD n=1 Tax=Rhodovulum sp. P5 TaxID=1564506 RepID=UPI0009C358CE|nr:threonine-phosphate decarboxylase CobD [Rhodovulum sp. P5]ARE39606.1 L-threonine 3-O-phosphate decarboxylase [Rhodovulum sp. P5]